MDTDMGVEGRGVVDMIGEERCKPDGFKDTLCNERDEWKEVIGEFKQLVEREIYLDGWRAYRRRRAAAAAAAGVQDRPAMEAEVSSLWFVGKRGLETMVAERCGKDVQESFGSLEKDGYHCVAPFLEVSLGVLSKEAVEARRLLRTHRDTMSSKAFSITLAFLVSCYADARFKW